MHTRRSVLATSGIALAAALSGCSALGIGSGDGDANLQGLSRWLTEEVADADVQERVFREVSGPSLRNVSISHPVRAGSVDALSEEAMEQVTQYDVGADVSLPMEAVESIIEIHETEIALGDFDAPAPPAAATQTGRHRGATLYCTEDGTDDLNVDGYAVGEGIFAYLPAQPTTDAATSSLRTLLDANAGEGTPIDADGQVDRIRSFLVDGFFEAYRALAGRERTGLSLHAEGDVVHSRSIMLLPTESEARERKRQVQQWTEADRSGDEDRDYRDFSPYESVDVRREGRAVKTVGTIPASAVGFPEFAAP